MTYISIEVSGNSPVISRIPCRGRDSRAGQLHVSLRASAAASSHQDQCTSCAIHIALTQLQAAAYSQTRRPQQWSVTSAQRPSVIVGSAPIYPDGECKVV